MAGTLFDEPLTRLQVVVLGFSGVGAMPIEPSLELGLFESDATAAIGDAFEAARKELQPRWTRTPLMVVETRLR